MDHYVALRTASGAAAGEKGQAYLQSLVPLVHRNRDAVATDAILDAHCQQLSPTSSRQFLPRRREVAPLFISPDPA